MPKMIRGVRFLQKNLETSLESAIAGHRSITQTLLSGLAILLCLLNGLVTGFLGSFLAFNSIVPGLNEGAGKLVDPNLLVASESLIAVLVVVIGIVTATFQPFSRSVSITMVSGAILVIVFFIVLKAQNRLPPEFLLTAVSGALISLVLSYFTFFVTRFVDALADVVWIKSHLFKGVAATTILLLAIIGALAGISTTQDNEIFVAIWSTLPEAQSFQVSSTLIAVGVISTLAVTFSAWFKNRRRGVPWNHPDLLRSLALAVGSWRATSFHNLDLSNISFQGAHLANTDLRARKLYRTCFRDVTGLERARTDNRYLDLEIPKVQKLLTHIAPEEADYDRLNLRGAYLQGADLRRCSFIDADLSGADLQAADLRGAILARTQAIGVDFSNANLTGICIQDWSVNNETQFTNVLCDYIYRELDEKGEPTDRYPADRNFEPQEFESLYQEIGNVAELVFKEGVNWRAFSFSMQKLELEDDGMGLELKGFERKGDRWVVRVTHNQHIPRQEVENRLTTMYEEMKGLLAAKEEQIHKLLGIASDQAEALKEISQKPFGNSFFITGSTITNLTGSGSIEYTTVAQQVREIVTYGSDRNQVVPIVKQFVQQVKQQQLATSSADQLELMQQLMVAEAETDPAFRAYLLHEGQSIIQAMSGTVLAKVIQQAIATISYQE